MMGQQTGLQERLFYEFRLEDWVPVDHLLRKIDGVLDLSGLRHQLGPFYSHTGRPSVDPELMVRMLLIGYADTMPMKRPKRSLAANVSAQASAAPSSTKKLSRKRWSWMR
jgi:transposase